MCQGTRVITVRPHVPDSLTRETVTHCVAFGLAEDAICLILRCTPSELKSCYPDELKYGLDKVNAQVGAALLHAALNEGDVNAQKFWLLNKAGWKDKKTDDEPGENDRDVLIERRLIVERILKRATRVDASVVATQDQEPVAKANGKNGKANGSNGNGVKHK